MLKSCRNFLNTQPLSLSWISFNNHYSKHWGNTTFNHTPVVSQCILIAADQNSTALLANRTDRPEVKTTAFCVVCKKKKLKQVSPSPSSPPKSGESLLEYYADTLQGLTLTRTEGRAKRLYASQNPEQLHEG